MVTTSLHREAQTRPVRQIVRRVGVAVIHYKATTAIPKSGVRVVETLNVAGMIRNRRLARSGVDAGMSDFLVKLEYKCRWFASSKLCLDCSWKKDDLIHSDRGWWCGCCGVLDDGDADATKNLANGPGLSLPVKGRGDRVRQAMSAVVGEASRGSMHEVCAPAMLDYQISSDFE